MNWQLIETAPKDQRILLYRPAAAPYWQVMGGNFIDDRYAKNPKPYWQADNWNVGKTAARECPPTHWMPIPDHPCVMGIK